MSTEVLSETSQQQGTYFAYSVFKSGVINKNSNCNNPVPLPNFNETICFGGDSRSFRDIVYNSKIRETLNLSIEMLTNDSETSRLAGRNKKNEERGIEIRIPRPQNAWIIYRRDKSSEFEGLKSSLVSGEVSKKWKNESKEVVEYFAALALLANENHFNKYGKGYKYQPRQRARMVKKLKNNNKQKEKRVIHKENIENTEPKTMFPTPASLPQVSLTPPSPSNEYEYLPTPTSSIQHSPVSLPSLVKHNEYLPTPASTIQCSPVTSEEDYLNDNYLLEFPDVYTSGLLIPPLSDIHVVSDQNPLMSEEVAEFLINAENLTTSASTIQCSPETSEEDYLNDNYLLESPDVYTSGLLIPPLSVIHVVSDQNPLMSEEVTEFSINADNLTTSTLPATTTTITPETQFNFNECGSLMDASPESTMDISIQPSVTNSVFFGYDSFTHYDPLEWKINNASPYPDQMDYVSEYNTTIDQPSL